MSGLILTVHMAVLVIFWVFLFSLVLSDPWSWSLDGSELNISQSLLNIVNMI